MADLLKATLRGTFKNARWAVNIWFSKVSPVIVVNEAEQAEALANGLYLDWLDKMVPILSNQVNTNKVVVEGYDTPSCYFELNTNGVGTLTGEVCPQFVAMGFRQFRTNSDFRVATHRVPGVREVNNFDGSFVYGQGVDAPETALAGEVFSEAIPATIGDTEYEFQPVLIRTRYTPRGVPNPITTIFDPPQTSPVPSAGFYGITSQVSRKIITPS